jgi:drug/metabolite transporter (DMT)-like permease
MQEMTLDTILAVFEEMFGPALFWALVAVAALITLAFVYVLIRDRNLESRRFLRAELAAPVGAIAAILFVQWITNSGFRDVGGPIDWVVLLLIGVAGAGGLMILVYTGLALFGRRRDA